MEKEKTEQELLQQGKKRVLKLLEQKDYSRKELRERLKKEDYTQDFIDQIIAYADSFHYLDDVRVAGSYIRARKGYKSRRELNYLLKQKGISEEEISLAFEENYKEEDGISQEEIAIRKYLTKYHVTEETIPEMSYEEKQKIAAKLYRKGFAREEIRRMLVM